MVAKVKDRMWWSLCTVWLSKTKVEKGIKEKSVLLKTKNPVSKILFYSYAGFYYSQPIKSIFVVKMANHSSYKNLACFWQFPRLIYNGVKYDVLAISLWFRERNKHNLYCLEASTNNLLARFINQMETDDTPNILNSLYFMF